MKKTNRFRSLGSIALALLTAMPLTGQQADQQPPQQRSFTLKVEEDAVLTTVFVRDKQGHVVRGLKRDDFEIYENGKKQTIDSFDFEDVDQATPLDEATVSGTGAKAPHQLLGTMSRAATSKELEDHRLIVMFFDLTSMQPDDLDRAQVAARNYINKQMEPADLVAVVSLSTSVSLDQDFTASKQLLLAAVNGYSGVQGSGFAAGATSTTNQVEDTTAYTADESEYNDMNTDVELYAFEDISKALAYINEKKSILYFSGGLTRDGIENQASLHAAVNAAVRANVSIYSVDARGLQAISPLGDASTGSLRGNSGFSGSAQQNNLDANFNSQETLATLSDDTGGKAFFDSNDFGPAFQRIQADTSAYYMIGFRSTDKRRDGSYRKLSIKLIGHPDLKLEFRPGYNAPADFKHSNGDDRERQLQEELASDLPATDIEVYLQAYYFRDSPGTGPQRFDVPVSLIVPGSQIPFIQGGDKTKATLDIIGELKNSAGVDIADVRQTVKLSVDNSQQVTQKNVQYTTVFTVPQGKYHVKFVVRENETGRMGSFETDLNLPDLSKPPLKVSSVLLASQRDPATKKDVHDPLTSGGYLLIPNINHVFRADQHLYLLYEVYDPTGSIAAKTAADKVSGGTGGMQVLTSIEFLRGTSKVFETPLVEANALNVPARGAVAFAFDVPLSQLKPGPYICQVNIIDDTGASFSFPRQAILIRPPAPAAPATATATPGPAPGH
ncbi:MAG TPA: VWA domain-containing protein [Acidobacteriaceae bacterium]|nr:VWA domain-containing protein [Acidobacteriaceae bacterium]